MFNSKLKLILNIIVYLLALWGLALTLVFFAMKFGWTKSSGSVDDQSQYFQTLQNQSQDMIQKNINNIEKIKIANENWGEIKNLEEWQAIKAGLIKDYSLIDKVSKETGVSKRILITPLVVEQLRLMTSQREIFKRYFQPLSVLGAQTQFSLGIYGMKENTAKQVEANLKNKNSPFYLGTNFENLLDYKNISASSSILVDANSLEQIKASVSSISTSTSTLASATNTKVLIGSDAERVKRLTNEKDHTYSYLYAALYLKQILAQWKNAVPSQPSQGEGEIQKSFDISNRPEILNTVYNLGFEKSAPKANPEVGGATIELNGKNYTFGSLAFYFYYSDEMNDIFN